MATRINSILASLTGITLYSPEILGLKMGYREHVISIILYLLKTLLDFL